MKIIYRGFDVYKTANGFYEWHEDLVDCVRIHTGKVDGTGGFRTEDEVYKDIDAHKRLMAQ